MIHQQDCSAEAVFGIDCAELLKVEPCGHAIERGGPHGLDIKKPYWGLAKDPVGIPDCILVLTKFLDGSPITLRYRHCDIIPNGSHSTCG
jgi:hypothetical protein